MTATNASGQHGMGELLIASLAYRVLALLLLSAVWYGLLALGVPLPWPFLVLFGSTALLACLSALTLVSLLGSLVAGAPLDSLTFSTLLAPMVLVVWIRGRLLQIDSEDHVWPDACTEAARWSGRLLLLIAAGYALAATMESFDPRQVLLHALVAFLFGTALSRVPGRIRKVDRAALALTAGVTLFCFAMLEVASRVLVPKPQVPPELFQHHPQNDFAHTPSLQMTMGFGSTDIADAPDVPIRINALGLRGEEIPTPKPSDELRIVCLGDSYTFGWGALEENTYPAQLAALLREAHPGQSIRVINAGVGSYAPWQERVLLREKFAQLSPDILVLQTFVTNDIAETLVRQGKVLESYSPEWLEFLTTYRFSGTAVFRFNRWLRHSCNLYFVLEHEVIGDWTLVRAYKRFRWRPSHGLPRPFTLADRLWIAEPDLREWYPVLQEGFEALCDDVDGIIDDCRKAGVPVVAFNIPWFVGMMHRPPPVMARNDGMYEQGRAAKLMETHLAASADVALALIDEFLADPNPSRFTYNRDGHFVRDTNALLAARLADAIAPMLHQAAGRP